MYCTIVAIAIAVIMAAVSTYSSLSAIRVHFVLSRFTDFNRYGIKSFILFPKIDDKLKSNYAEESYNPSGIIPRALQMIKEKFPEVVVCTDVALDPYSSEVCIWFYCFFNMMFHTVYNMMFLIIVFMEYLIFGFYFVYVYMYMI